MWLSLHYSVIGPTFVVVVVGDGSGSVYGGTRFISKDRNSLNNLNMGSLKEEVFYTGIATSIGSLFPVLCMSLFIWNKRHLLQ
jgi:VIT1/CCC1 family predicted Fe2+/Mn2+ transporter